MSRTDKDTPMWTQALWEPQHVGCQYATYCRWGVYGPRVECDLPPERPPGRVPRPRAGRRVGLDRPWPCIWVPVYDRARRYHHDAHQPNPPHWFRDHRWYDPERNVSRTELGVARGEYRATGEVDIVATTRQHRHSCAWDWD